jgi:protein-S-isoprenylcysteine O-methyltransferase Ste14
MPLAAGQVKWRRGLRLLTRKRVLITRIAVPLLILQNVLGGLRPHNPFDASDLAAMTGLALVTAGLLLRALAAGALNKRGGLSVGGPYRMLRNPLYVGSYLIMCGFCTIIGDIGNLVFVLGPLLILYLLKVEREEHSLAVQHGAAWVEYAHQTLRYLPGRLANPLSGWQAGLWRANREYRVAAASLAALAGLACWHAARG